MIQLKVLEKPTPAPGKCPSMYWQPFFPRVTTSGCSASLSRFSSLSALLGPGRITSSDLTAREYEAKKQSMSGRPEIMIACANEDTKRSAKCIFIAEDTKERIGEIYIDREGSMREDRAELSYQYNN